MKTTTEARLVKIETTLDYVKQGLDDNRQEHKALIGKIDEFIASADKKYATKEEVKELKEKAKSNSSKIWDMGMKLAGVASSVTLIILIITKVI